MKGKVVRYHSRPWNKLRSLGTEVAESRSDVLAFDITGLCHFEAYNYAILSAHSLTKL